MSGLFLRLGIVAEELAFFDGALAASDGKGGTARIPERVLAIGARAESGTHQPTKHSTNLQRRQR